MKKVHVRRQERGYAMAALLVAMSVMAIVAEHGNAGVSDGRAA